MEDHARTHLQLAVCDDEAADRADGRSDIARRKHRGGDRRLSAALLAAIRAGRAFDVLLLDVMMEGMDDMALAAALRAGHEDAAIIFISSNREMALRGYEVAAARYLAKPVDRAKLCEALLYCCNAHEKQRTLVLPTASGQSRFAPSAIIYVEAWERGVCLNLGDEKAEVKIPISQIAGMLPEGQFAYCHRTLLVNLNYVRHVRYCELELKSGERLPISKYRLAEFKSAFLRFLKD